MQELVRLKAIDGIELVGILYHPVEDKKKIVVHVHGLNGNFYENHFVDILAKTYNKLGYGFLIFNNRGKDFISELFKDEESVVIGGSLENFQDSLRDVGGVLQWVKDREYQEIVLEGHSYGCNKVLYYYSKYHDDLIKKMVLLAPCDIPSLIKHRLSKEEYLIVKEKASQLICDGKENDLVPTSLMANGYVRAGTFYYDFLPNGENDFIRYRERNSKSEVLNKINIPVYVVFGDQDECVLTKSIDVVKKYLEDNISNCSLYVIDGADHCFLPQFEKLEKGIYYLFEKVDRK